ncbi:MAG: shikimate kinase [Elusimicrobia bacterium]|nr:shikimate kinase [Elusimicrobiota bacterium]
MAKKNRKDPGPALNIYLTGFMCAGKTLAGRSLAAAMGRPFRDSDALLRKRTGSKLSVIIRREGLGAFRRLEAALVKELAARGGRVISLGGGVYPSKRWAGLLKRTGKTVFLSCPWPELAARLKAERRGRPLLDGPWEKALPRAKRLYEARLGFYRRADITIDTAGLKPGQTAEKIKKALSE